MYSRIDWIVGILFLMHVMNGESKLCPVGYHHNAKKGTCFTVSQKQATYDDAKNHCSVSGGQLLVVKDAETHKIVNDMLRQHTGSFWIGLQKQPGDTVFRWVDDNLESNYFCWEVGQPDNADDEDCVAIDSTSNLQWKDESCRSERYYICQTGDLDEGTVITTPGTPSKEPCPVGWQHDKQGSACYTSSTHLATWDLASKVCQVSGGNLAVIKDRNSHIFVNYVLSKWNHNHWIGLHKGKADGFHWLNEATKPTYLWWADNDPNNGENKSCVYASTGLSFGWRDSSCENALYFLCHRSELANYRRKSISYNVTCPEGWYLYEEKQMCFFLSTETANWQWASTKCQDENGNLATIQDPGTHIFFNDLVSETPKEYWLGLHDDVTDGVYTWLNNTSEAAYVYWSKDAPSNSDSKDCAYVNPRENYRWKTSACNTKYNYACQKPAIPPGPVGPTLSCPDNWHLFKGGRSCLFLSSDSKSWHEARQDCWGRDGDLVIIPDAFTSSIVNGLVEATKRDYYIGFNDIGKEGNFFWLDYANTKPSFLNWNEGEPNNYDGEDCASISQYPPHMWFDYDCERGLPYICQKPAHLGNSTDVAWTHTRVCPPGWYYFAHLDTCHFMAFTRANFYGARAHCQLVGADLTVIKDDETLEFYQALSTLRKHSGYIGLNDIDEEGSFHWLDEKEDATFLRWASREPNNLDNEDCVVAGTEKWNDISCLVTAFYSCQKAASNVTMSIDVSKTGQQGAGVNPHVHGEYNNANDTCPTGWHLYENGNDRTCFGFLDVQISWYGARVHCQYYGGDLVTIRNNDTYEFVNGLFVDDENSYWIGLHDSHFDGAYHWLDDILKIDSFQWASNQPDNHNDEDCVTVQQYPGAVKGSDEPCNNKYRPFCQRAAYRDGVIPTTVPTIPTPRPSQPCLDGWRYFEMKQTCFLLSTIQASWTTARTYCGRLGGDLAVIDGGTKQMVVNDMIQQQPLEYWIGLSDIRQEGRFSWLDNTEETDFSWWASGEPSFHFRGDDCVDIRRDAFWYDYHCDNSRFFICERKAVQESNATATPALVTGPCLDGWYYNPKTQMCYSTFHDKKTWFEARTECQKYENGDLTVIEDLETNIFVNEIFHLRIDEYWIGLQDLDVEGEFIWVGKDRKKIEYSWWQRNNPSGSEGKNCVLTNKDWPFPWTDSPCGIPQAFFCQASPPTPTTTPTTTSSTTTTTTATTTTTEPKSTSKEKSETTTSEGMSTVVVVVIVIAALVAVIIVVATVFFLKRRVTRGSYGDMGSPPEGFENVSYDNTSGVNLAFPDKSIA